MTEKIPPQLHHFVYDQWVDEDGDGINLVIWDPERQAIEVAFAELMKAYAVDADGRYTAADMETAWLVATKGRPQVSRWLGNPAIANSRGDTCPTHREPLACPPTRLDEFPQRLGVMWSSAEAEPAVQLVVAAHPHSWPSLIMTGKYYLSERPENFIPKFTQDLVLPAWTEHCSGMEGPITLLARLDEIVFVLPAKGSDDIVAVLDTLPQTMRWVLWTAHQLDFPYTVVGLDGEIIPSPASHLAGTATAAEVEAASAARKTFTQELSSLAVEFNCDGSGLYLRNRPVPMDLLDVPFTLVRRLSRWQEWGEELSSESNAGRVPDQARVAFEDEASILAADLRVALGAGVDIELSKEHL